MASELWTLALVLLAPVVLRKGTQFLFPQHTPSSRQQRDSSSDGDLAAGGQEATLLRLALSSPFQLAIVLVTAAVVLVSVRNLVPVRYGVQLSVPAPVIETLQRTFYTLYTSPTPTVAEPLRIALRGGYESDIFLGIKASITIPTATLRSLLVAAPSLLDLGFIGTEADLQSLIARLSSYDGRKLYLLVGAGPLTDCVFCHASKEYFYYALPGLVRQYAWRIIAIGFLTSSPADPTALLVRRIARLLQLRPLSPQQPQFLMLEPDRKRWRLYATSALLAMLGAEALVLSELGEVRGGQGRWNHWHANLDILRQLLFALLVLGVYLFPSHPQPSTFERMTATMRTTHARLEKTLANLEAAAVTRSVIWRDEGLVRKVADWHATQQRDDTGPDCDAMVAFARKISGIDVPRLVDVCSGAAQVTLEEAELINRELDKGALAAQLARSERQSEAISPTAASDQVQQSASSGPSLPSTASAEQTSEEVQSSGGTNEAPTSAAEPRSVAASS